MLISIVTGTYNRIYHLQQFIHSVRESLGKGIEYEIVLVDGGSTDGTIEWAKSQTDVVLICHGKLLGAVKAFNDGARAAKGDYVILANDDILIEKYTIQAAISFMQDNPDVGVGCFYQDRDSKEPYVDTMPAIIRGQQGRAYYGQVCIVPRYLGNKVGWWGNYLRTYGGDNELSANILQAGYRIEPVPCSFIHDGKLEDGLRESNAQHPDSKKFYDKWTRADGLVGPVIPNSYMMVDIPRYVRIFYAPIYERPYSIQYQTKRGLRDALSRKGIVQECDYTNMKPSSIIDMACAFDADLFVMQIQDWNSISDSTLNHLRRNHSKAVFVNWNGDYHPKMLNDINYMRLMRWFDHCGFVTNAVGDRYKGFGVNWFYWQIGYEVADSKPRRDTPKHDVLFLGNGYSEQRQKLAAKLLSIGVNTGIYGFWEGVQANGVNLYDFDAGARLYGACKIAIGDSQWPRAGGFVSNRLFQSMAAGAFLLHQRFDGAKELLGLEDGLHLVMWDSLDELEDLVRYWLDPARAALRKTIAMAGRQYILSNHSFDNRVNELWHRLGWDV